MWNGSELFTHHQISDTDKTIIYIVKSKVIVIALNAHKYAFVVLKLQLSSISLKYLLSAVLQFFVWLNNNWSMLIHYFKPNTGKTILFHCFTPHVRPPTQCPSYSPFSLAYCCLNSMLATLINMIIVFSFIVNLERVTWNQHPTKSPNRWTNHRFLSN